jgi:probable HAF family extracellular repeat protein
MIRKRRSTFKPCLEILEDRCCPSSYAVTDLGTFGGTYSQAQDISPTGQVVGQAARPGDSGSAGAAFLWQNGVMSNLGTLGGANSDATGINKFTQVVGNANTATGAVHAFLWQNGVMTDLGTLGGNDSGANDINNSGEVVGSAYTASGAYHAYEWQSGVMTDLNTLIPANSGWVLTNAYGVNDNGQIVGQGVFNGQATAFLLSGGVVTNLAPGWLAYALNNSTQVVGGESVSSSQEHGFLYSGGTMTDLGALGSPKNGSEAHDINTASQVVGYSTTDWGGGWSAFNAFIWQNGKMTNLNKLLVSSSSGWQLHDARGINDTGYIVGMGTNSSGQNHAFLAIDPSRGPTTATTVIAASNTAPATTTNLASSTTTNGSIAAPGLPSQPGSSVGPTGGLPGSSIVAPASTAAGPSTGPADPAWTEAVDLLFGDFDNRLLGNVLS